MTDNTLASNVFKDCILSSEPEEGVGICIDYIPHQRHYQQYNRGLWIPEVISGYGFFIILHSQLLFILPVGRGQPLYGHYLSEWTEYTQNISSQSMCGQWELFAEVAHVECTHSASGSLIWRTFTKRGRLFHMLYHRVFINNVPTWNESTGSQEVQEHIFVNNAFYPKQGEKKNAHTNRILQIGIPY